MHNCTLAVECMSVVLSGMGVSSGGLVSTQDRHKYNTWHSLFSPGNTNYRTNFAFASVCIRFAFPMQNKAWHLLYTYETDLWVVEVITLQ